ncbi:MAG TPA: HAD family hydrolase [Candidatus Binatia bacterium]|jgi:putative hydrolase of the HAD superfamily
MFIFFDIDGTLIDQRNAEQIAIRAMLETYGHLLARPYSMSESCRRWRLLREKHARAFFCGLISLQEQRRRRVRDFLGGAYGCLPGAEIDQLFALYESHYRANWKLFDDVLPALESLRHLACGIISNGASEQQLRKLRLTNIERYFDIVVVAEEAGAAKPQREIFLTACRRAGAPAERCIYVGDRLDHDALASRSIGMRSFWLDRRNSRTRTNVEVINSLGELSWRLRDRLAV